MLDSDLVSFQLGDHLICRVDGVAKLANATDAFLPIVWFDDGIEELKDPDIIALLK